MQKIRQLAMLTSLMAGLSPHLMAKTSNVAIRAAYDFNAKNFNSVVNSSSALNHTPGTNSVDFYVVGSNGTSIIPIGPDAPNYIAADRNCDNATCYYKYYANDGFDNSHLEFQFKTDRKDSEEIVNWVNNELTAENLQPPPNGGKYQPQKLAFAYRVDLRFLDELNHLTVCKNIILAQGHYGSNHDWYVYSNYYNQAAVFTRLSTYHTLIKCSDETKQQTTYYLVTPTNMNNFDIECTFTLQQITPAKNYRYHL